MIVYRVTGDSTTNGSRWVTAVKLERDPRRRFPDVVLATATLKGELDMDYIKRILDGIDGHAT